MPKGGYMGLFNKMKEPVFLKEESDALRQLEVLKALELRLNSEGKEKLRQDIKLLEYGIQGENQITFELKNSHMPMYILHDIYLESDELAAQIDYLVFTRKLCFIIECKNLYGNIEINNQGDFIRTMEFGRWNKKEGIYSPITQNQRHMELIKKIKFESKKNLISKFMTTRYFETFYRPIVVLANPKTVLNAKYAKKEVKQQVIRADQLISYMKEQNHLSKELANSDSELKEWAESFLILHKNVEKDYVKKYETYILQEEPEDAETIKLELTDKNVEPAGGEIVKSETNVAEVNEENFGNEIKLEDTDLFKELKAYRLKKSREEKVKPYFLYNDKQLRELIAEMPKDKVELQRISGFGPVKAEKYGDDILAILKEFS